MTGRMAPVVVGQEGHRSWHVDEASNLMSLNCRGEDVCTANLLYEISKKTCDVMILVFDVLESPPFVHFPIKIELSYVVKRNVVSWTIFICVL